MNRAEKRALRRAMTEAGERELAKELAEEKREEIEREWGGPAGSNREDLQTNAEKRAMLRAHMGRGGKVDGYR